MSGKTLKVYIAGKVSHNSSFGKTHWRDNFCKQLSELSSIKLINIDPTKNGVDQTSPQITFGVDAYSIKNCDVLIVYLSDDISVGGSQEILIAKYFKKPVIALVPFGGKFNGSTREYMGKVIRNYKDPFVFSTCDIIVSTIEEVAASLKSIKALRPITIDIIEELSQDFEQNQLKDNKYLKKLLK